MGPKLSSTLVAAASTCSGSATSVGRTSALPPSSSTSRRAPSNPSRPRASRPMWAPRLAKARTMARPTPAEAPVTTTTSGVLACILLCSFLLRRGLSGLALVPLLVVQWRQAPQRRLHLSLNHLDVLAVHLLNHRFRSAMGHRDVQAALPNRNTSQFQAGQPLRQPR